MCRCTLPLIQHIDQKKRAREFRLTNELIEDYYYDETLHTTYKGGNEKPRKTHGEYNILYLSEHSCPICSCYYRVFKDEETLEKYKILMFQIKLDNALGIRNELALYYKESFQ
jgi:hypothetical protein